MSFIEHTIEHDKSFLDVNKLKKGDLIYYRNDLLYFERILTELKGYFDKTTSLKIILLP